MSLRPGTFVHPVDRGVDGVSRLAPQPGQESPPAAQEVPHQEQVSTPGVDLDVGGDGICADIIWPNLSCGGRTWIVSLRDPVRLPLPEPFRYPPEAP